MNFFHSKIFLLFFLLTLLLVDFFIIPKLDPVCRSGQGYGFAYPMAQKSEQINQMRYGWSRVGYNFSHFFIFWTKPPFGKSIDSLVGFLKLDNNPLWLNIGHFVAFFVFTLILFYIFHLDFLSIFLIILFVNIFHEYVAEGICVDPSFNDLWVDMGGFLFALLFSFLWQNFLKRKFFSQF